MPCDNVSGWLIAESLGFEHDEFPDQESEWYISYNESQPGSLTKKIGIFQWERFSRFLPQFSRF